MLKQTPANGSPFLKVASKISPAQGASRFSRENSRCREPVGSRDVRCDSVTASRAFGKRRRAEGGGGYVFMAGLRTRELFNEQHREQK